MEKEIRMTNTKFEIRSEGENEKPVIVGYAAMFDSPADETNGFIEKIASGAFSDALKTSDTRALINHDPGQVLGRVKSGTLKLKEDDKGLYYEIDPPDTTYANDLIESMRRGDIDQSSFGFVIESEEWDDSGEIPVRTIKSVKELFDVSPVTYPWYENTESGLKSKEEVLQEYRGKQAQLNKRKNDYFEKKLKTRRKIYLGGKHNG